MTTTEPEQKMKTGTVELRSCDNDSCRGGRAWKTDKSVGLDSSKMFCSANCADEWASNAYWAARMKRTPDGFDEANQQVYEYDGCFWCDAEAVRIALRRLLQDFTLCPECEEHTPAPPTHATH